MKRGSLAFLAGVLGAGTLASVLSLASRSDSAPPAVTEHVRAGRTQITLPDTTEYSALARRILGLERERSAAIARGDTTWLATLYAADFEGIAANGRRIGRADLFRLFARDDPESRFTIDELSARDYG